MKIATDANMSTSNQCSTVKTYMFAKFNVVAVHHDWAAAVHSGAIILALRLSFRPYAQDRSAVRMRLRRSRPGIRHVTSFMKKVNATMVTFRFPIRPVTY